MCFCCVTIVVVFLLLFLSPRLSSQSNGTPSVSVSLLSIINMSIIMRLLILIPLFAYVNSPVVLVIRQYVKININVAGKTIIVVIVVTYIVFLFVLAVVSLFLGGR